MNQIQEPLVKNLSPKRYKSLLRVLLMAANMSLGSFYFGYTMVHLAYIPFNTIVIAYNIQINLSVAKGLLNACVPSGALIGSFCAIYFLQRFSRRQCILGANVVAMALGIGIVLLPNFPTLLIGRLGQGFCVGMYSAIVPLIIKEQTPLQLYSITGTFHQINISLGVFGAAFFVYLLSIITGDSSLQTVWTFVIAFTLFPVIVQTLALILFFKGETIKYHLLRKQHVQAKLIIQETYLLAFHQQVFQQKINDVHSANNTRQDSLISTENKDTLQHSACSILQPTQNEQQTQKIIRNQIQTVPQSRQVTQKITNSNKNCTKEMNQITDKENKCWLTLIVGIHLSILQQFSGMNAVTSYGGAFASEQFPEYRNLFTWMLNLDKLLGALISLVLLKRVGRKKMIQIGGLIIALMNCLVGIGTFIEEKNLSRALIFSGLFGFMLVYGCTLGSVIFVYLPEIVQPYKMPLTQMANWIGAIFIIFLFPIIKDLAFNGNPGPIFFFFSFWCLASYFANRFLLIETNAKHESQIKAQFILIQNKFH